MPESGLKRFATTVPLSDTLPFVSEDGAPLAGVSKEVSRADHRHGALTATAPRTVFSGGRADTVFDGTIRVRIRCGGAY